MKRPLLFSVLIIFVIISLFLIINYFRANYYILRKDVYGFLSDHDISPDESRSVMRSRVFYPEPGTGAVKSRLIWVPRVTDTNDKISLITSEFLNSLENSTIRIKRIFFAHGTRVLYLDLYEFETQSFGSALDEYYFILALAKTLRYNFPFIKSIQILLNGEHRQTLDGHLNIEGPLIIDSILKYGDRNETG